MYYLNTVEQVAGDIGKSNNNRVSLACDIYKWLEILGHCNFDDIIRLESVVSGMKIVGKVDKSKLECGTCTESKFVDSRSRKADSRTQI